ncbi:hypothetical protein CP533_1471 [Ophiocordyceps camponoti-saundersi (nom. inval.)]|nr:hypothetical protein CP533_1471 [Ophiocordyceps camponoti-saundersi (nom. inval.)]
MKFSAVAVAAFAGLSYAEMQANAANSEQQAELEYNPLGFLGIGASLGINFKNIKCASTCFKKALGNAKCENRDGPKGTCNISLLKCGCDNLESVAREAAACATGPSCRFPNFGGKGESEYPSH